MNRYPGLYPGLLPYRLPDLSLPPLKIYNAAPRTPQVGFK